MLSSSGDDELLSILLTNLRNAGATLGEDSQAYKAIKATVDAHVRSMTAKGNATNITAIRQTSQVAAASNPASKNPASQFLTGSLAYRPKPGSK